MFCFNKQGYDFDVITFVHDVTNKILSRGSNYIVDMVMWPMFGNSSISMREVIKPQFFKDLTWKTTFFERCSWFKINNLGLALGIVLKFYTNVAKELKLKVKKFWGLIPTSVEVQGKSGRGAFLPPLILNRVKWKEKRAKVTDILLVSLMSVLNNIYKRCLWGEFFCCCFFA